MVVIEFRESEIKSLIEVSNKGIAAMRADVAPGNGVIKKQIRRAEKIHAQLVKSLTY